MSLVPHFPSDAFDDWSLWPQHFYHPWLGYHPYQPWVHEMAVRDDDYVNLDKDKFKVNVDVQHFKPEEITVKVKGNTVTVEGKHEERPDEHGYISRQFERRYTLPDEIDPDGVATKLSSDGVLTIEGPKKPHSSRSSDERIISVARTNKPAVPGFFHGIMDKFKHFILPSHHSSATQEKN
ncbi:alpha-crystallin A chain [Anabrus simplex]|uniref:alpha-crystallin A chain n=1 Tax=Anabrus simplex TaxID=316456 RepID=UPI0035A26984